MMATGQAWPGSSHLSKTLDPDGFYRFKARFHDFTGRAVTLNFTMPSAWGHESAMEFGVSQQELTALYRRCREQPVCDRAALARDRRSYYRHKAVRLRTLADGRLRMFVDVPAVVARNRGRVMPIVGALRRQAEREGRDKQWMVEAAMALVQDGIAYRQPKKIEDGRHIMGFYPPPRMLEQGYGDCDTKSALLAAILQNITNDRIIGVHIPDHYLLGIATTPRGDQASIDYEGKTYVLVEAVGPALRRPGDLSDRTLAALEQGERMRIDPMY